MSKWRPSHLNCLYVIPDIHGNLEQLNLILKRILPLRKSDGGNDMLIFLGDYIDRGPNNFETIEKLIEVKQKFPNQTIFLRGNHENLLLNSVGISDDDYMGSFGISSYSMWINNGGAQTISEYIKHSLGEDLDPFQFTSSRIKDIIPKSHIDFFTSTELYYEKDNFIFVHGGCNPMMPMEEQREITFMWDRSLYEAVQLMLLSGKELEWDKTIVTGHNYKGPFIHEKFMMLDCSRDKKLMVVELNSMEAMEARHGKDRLVKTELKETVVKGSFRRAGSLQ